MNFRVVAVLEMMLFFLFLGCQSDEVKYTPTAGTVTIECDESVLPVITLLVNDFQRQYEKAKIVIRGVEGREAVADFASDSVRYIVMGRQFDQEERTAIAGGKIEFQEYNVALGAVAVIVNKRNPLTQIRLGLLDSIFSGTITRWPDKNPNGMIDIAIGGPNSSTNLIFRTLALKGKPLSVTATPFPSSEKLLEYVQNNSNAIGIVGLSWLRGKEADVQVLALGGPGWRPDTTESFGRYYPPVQAHIHRKFYPINTPVYIYRREVLPDVGYGFISYATSGAGQKLFLNNGLVPVTMPVRLVTLTSKGVQ